jgi:proteasome accessory factor A
VLTNGARYYVDHAHPELSTPECADALSVVLQDRAAEMILIESMEAANEFLPEDQELVVYKNNSDGKGNSYGCHENYLMDRSTPFGRIVQHATTHFVTRQVFTGAGKVGCELPHRDRSHIEFQLTQRADFFEEEVGLETTLKRPIINTRDEPHADPLRYRRLHVIVGDANLCEVATFLKLGTTAIVLGMVEDDVATSQRLASPTMTCSRLYLRGSAWGSSRVLIIGRFRVVSRPTSSSKKSARCVSWNSMWLRSRWGSSQPTLPAPVNTCRVTKCVVACWTIRPNGVDRSIR